MGYESEIVIGVILGTIILIMIISFIFERLFPKSKISEKLEKLAYWIRDSVAI
ncbi:MAG: hypothetical protein AABX76_00455 [Nanoarchaeota archaeon]